MAALCRWLVVLLAAACCHALHNESSIGAAGGELGGGGFGRLAGLGVDLAPTWAEAAPNVGAFRRLVGGVAGCAGKCHLFSEPTYCILGCTNMITSSTILGQRNIQPYTGCIGSCVSFFTLKLSVYLRPRTCCLSSCPNLTICADCMILS